ncbi:hypothetical protein [Bradyrhizobium sp. Ash2021]|uniref:hypothetical protein n=1 Tax=Bradyrhizobium sp. Ash2021 TaxID=2954771 RepID=UPI002814DA32|nr:hypothetical protein [Bradyrhizobium sp. Ash2021]WMT74518.1 hypothetical protein NL528_42705 [Bradyrhizobium sp. Ash2021]
MTDTDARMTRRIVFFGAAASLICAPAIIRAASLMPVRTLQLGALNPEGEFYRRGFYHSLDSDLRAGCAMSVRSNKKISVAEAQRMIARARAKGWLPPYSPSI